MPDVCVKCILWPDKSDPLSPLRRTVILIHDGPMTHRLVCDVDIGVEQGENTIKKLLTMMVSEAYRLGQEYVGASKEG